MSAEGIAECLLKGWCSNLHSRGRGLSEIYLTKPGSMRVLGDHCHFAGGAGFSGGLARYAAAEAKQEERAEIPKPKLVGTTILPPLFLRYRCSA